MEIHLEGVQIGAVSRSQSEHEPIRARANRSMSQSEYKPIRARVDRTSIRKGKKEDILSRRKIQEKISFRKFKFWPRVRLPNFELENSKFDLSLFTSLQRQTSKGICTRQMYKINMNKQQLLSWVHLYIFETLNQKDEVTWCKIKIWSRKITKITKVSWNINWNCTTSLHDCFTWYRKIKNSKIWNDSRVRHSKLLELNTNNHVYYSCHSFRKYRNYSRTRYIKSSAFTFIQV